MPGLGAPVRNEREVRTTLRALAPGTALGWSGRFVGLARWVALRHERRNCAFRHLGVHGLKESDGAKQEPRGRMGFMNARRVEARDERETQERRCSPCQWCERASRL